MLRKILAIFRGVTLAFKETRPLTGLDAISSLHQGAAGDLFVMNRITPPLKQPVEPIPSAEPARQALPEPYQGEDGEIFVPAIPLARLETS